MIWVRDTGSKWRIFMCWCSNKFLTFRIKDLIEYFSSPTQRICTDQDILNNIFSLLWNFSFMKADWFSLPSYSYYCCTIKVIFLALLLSSLADTQVRVLSTVLLCLSLLLVEQLTHHMSSSSVSDFLLISHHGNGNDCCCLLACEDGSHGAALQDLVQRDGLRVPCQSAKVSVSKGW